MIRSLFSGKKKKSRSNTETAPQPGEAPSIGRPVSPNALATQTAGPRSRTGTDTLGGLPPSIPPTLLLSPDALLLTSQITVHNNSGWYGALSSSATSRPLSRQTSFGGSVAIAVLLLNVPPRTISVTASVVQTIAEAREGATTRLRAEDEAARDADEGGDATKDVTPVHSSTTLLQREVAGWRHVAIPAGFSREPVALVYALPDSMSPSSILLAARLYPRAYSSASLSVHADSLSPKAQRVIIRSVASALFALHAAGLAHGSVCSARVVVDPTRTETLGPPVLVDAGMLPLVRATDAAATPPPPVDGVVSLAGKLYEAARWQAPEQLDDPTEVSAAADMYSFGALVYEVLLGEVPWDAFDVRDAVSRVRDGARLFIPDAVAPLLLRALLQRCFDLDGDARVDSAEAVDLLSREDWDVDPVAEAAAAATAEAAEQAARQVEQVAAPFRCDVCGKRYHYDSDLVQHTALRHPEVAAANEEAATSAAAAASSSSSSSSSSTSTEPELVRQPPSILSLFSRLFDTPPWATLHVLAAPSADTPLTSIEVASNSISIGRSRSANVQLPDRRLSSTHAKVHRTPQRNGAYSVTIEDVSSYGVYVNRKKVGRGEERVLRDGALVTFSAKSLDKGPAFAFTYRDVVPERNVNNAAATGGLGSSSVSTSLRTTRV